MRTPITDLSGEAIEAVLDEAIKRGPAAARMAGISLRTCLTGACRSARSRSRRSSRRRRGPPERERVLSEDELRRLYAAAGTLPALRGQVVPTRDAYRVPTHEVGELRWAEVHHLDDPALAEIDCRRREPKPTAGIGFRSAPRRAASCSRSRARAPSSCSRVGGRTPGKVRSMIGTVSRRSLTGRSASPRSRRGSFTICGESLVTILAGRPYSLNPFVVDKLLGHTMKLRGSGSVYQRQGYPEERIEALEI